MLGSKMKLLLLAAYSIFFLSRYPGSISNFPLSVDESLMLAAVLTVQANGYLPWQDFDTTTIGPVTVWFLTAVSSLCGPLSYTGLHTVAAALWSAMGTLALAISLVVSGKKGVALSFAILLGVSLAAWRPDYLHFTSELVPAFLLTWAALVIVKSVSEDTYAANYPRSFFCGLLCSLAIMAKLQSLPIAAFLCAAATLPAWRHGLPCLAKTGLTVSFGFAAPIAFLAVWLLDEGAVSLAVQSYFIGGASYGSSDVVNISFLLSRLETLAVGWVAMQASLTLIPVSIAVLLILGWRPWPFLRTASILFWFFAGWLFAALCAVLIPAFRFEHHGIFLIAPTVVLLSFLVCQLLSVSHSFQRGPEAAPRNRKAVAYASAIGLAGLWIIMSYTLLYTNWRAQTGLYKEFPGPELANVSGWVEKLVPPDAPIAVWGWAPEIFVLTGRPSASRHVIGHFLIEENAAREMHRTTFLGDLAKSPPAVIVDAVAPGFFLWKWGRNYSAYRLDSFPEFADFVRANYRLVNADSPGELRDSAMIYEYAGAP